jgi:hypothetical protein
MSHQTWGVAILWGLSTVVAVPAARAEEKLSAQAAFDKLKGLSGEWTAQIEGHEGGHATITYRVTGGGKVVMETLFPGTAHEMVSMYHMDGDELRMTHYCAVGNQPRLKLDREASSAETLVFVFDGGTNLDPAKDIHIHAGQIRFKDGGKVVEGVWEAYQGPEKFHTETFVMRRP